MALPPRWKARAADRGGSWYRQRAESRAGAAGHRRRIFGDRAFRKLLRKMPEAIRDEIFRMLEVTGDQIAAVQRADSPSRRVAAAISKRVSKRSLRLRVGLIGRPLNRRLFFARILEIGRRAQTVNVRRSTSRGGISSYQMRVRAMAPRPSIQSVRVKAIRDTLGGTLRGFWDRTLAQAARGVDDA